MAPIPLAQEPILPPTDPPTAVPEPTPAAPPAQSVTVVVAPRSDPPMTRYRWRWTRTGALLGLIAGLAAGYHTHSGQPAEFESAARVRVTGPAPADDAAAQVSAVRSAAVLDRAAQRLDDLRPFEVPPPKAGAARVAFLGEHLSVSPATGEPGPGSTLALTFLAPHPADAPKYLQAVLDAYRADLASRPVPAPKVAPKSDAPKAPPPPSANAKTDPAAELARIDAEQQRLNKQLADLTPEDAATIETRLAANRAAFDKAQVRLKSVERDLALIKATGASRRDRLATMEELGIKPEQPEAAAPSADLKAAEELVRTLELRKAELGQRLGPEHRDMVALDEQIKLAKERVAKATPATPKGPDELDRHRAKLEAERKGLTEQTKSLTAAVEKDNKLAGEVAAIRKQLLGLAAARRAQEQQIAANRPPAEPTAPQAATAPDTPPLPAGAYAIQVLAAPAAGERVGPPLYRSLLPGGLIGLVAGGLLGFLTALASELYSRRRPRIRPLPTTRVNRPTGTPVTSGPKLGIPVFTVVPTIDPDQPPEKRSVEGLSPLLVSFNRPNGPEAEAFRAARRELTAALNSRGHQVVTVTSPGPGDGKSVVAANLAISLAQSGKRVMLVDCDLRTPRVQELFKIGRLGDSLKSIMASEVDLRMAVRSCEVANLFLLPAGRGPMDPTDLLTRPKFCELLAELKMQYEYVIVDAPPTLAEAELAVLAQCADGAVLVVRAGADCRSRSDRAQGDLIGAGTRVLGAVVNSTPELPIADELPELPAPQEATPVK
jgi:capsular exopolysaccharide synthesis family protein